MSQFFIGNGGGGGGTVTTVDGNTGTAIPAAGVINVVGTGIAASGLSNAGNLYTTGAGNTLTIQETQAQFLNNYTLIGPSASPIVYNVLPTDFYISVDCSGNTVVIVLPNAPANYRWWVIKDKTGNSMMNNILITTVGGIIDIDNTPNYYINEDFESVNVMFNGSDFEVF